MTVLAADRLRPVDDRRLIAVHLRIWLSARAVLGSAAVGLVLGLLTVAVVIATHQGQFTAGSMRERFGVAEAAFELLWPIIGAAAAASAFSTRWAAVVLVVAPRRGRWLAAGLVALLLVAAAAALAFIVAAWLVTALAGAGFLPACAVLGRIGPVMAVTVLYTAVGFLVGAALRNIAAAVTVLFVLRWALPFLTFGHVDVGTWLNLDVVSGTLAGAASPDHGLPIVTALLAWIAVPAVGAWTRLRSGIGSPA